MLWVFHMLYVCIFMCVCVCREVYFCLHVLYVTVCDLACIYSMLCHEHVSVCVSEISVSRLYFIRTLRKDAMCRDLSSLHQKLCGLDLMFLISQN